MDTSILDNLGNLGNLGNLESLGSPDPGLITGLVLVASVLGLVLAVALIVFCIFYLFKFDALKDWVNDLADGEEIVEHRLSFSMLRPILATFVITGGCLAVAVLAHSRGAAAVLGCRAGHTRKEARHARRVLRDDLPGIRNCRRPLPDHGFHLAAADIRGYPAARLSDFRLRLVQ